MSKKTAVITQRGNASLSSMGDEFIRSIITNPTAVIQRLKSPDMKLWRKVRDSVIVPYLRNSRYGEMATKLNLEVDEVFDYIFSAMVLDDKLDKIRDEAQLIEYIRQYVRKYILELYRTPKRKIRTVTISDDAWAEWDRNHVHGSFSDGHSDELRSQVSEAVHRIWKRNPKSAYVLVMRVKQRLSAKEVQAACGISTIDNVNKIFQRAKGSMRQCLKRGVRG